MHGLVRDFGKILRDFSALPHDPNWLLSNGKAPMIFRNFVLRFVHRKSAAGGKVVGRAKPVAGLSQLKAVMDQMGAEMKETFDALTAP